MKSFLTALCVTVAVGAQARNISVPDASRILTLSTPHASSYRTTESTDHFGASFALRKLFGNSFRLDKPLSKAPGYAELNGAEFKGGQVAYMVVNYVRPEFDNKWLNLDLSRMSIKDVFVDDGDVNSRVAYVVMSPLDPKTLQLAREIRVQLVVSKVPRSFEDVTEELKDFLGRFDLSAQ